MVSYCGKDHQRQDWKAGHKSACKPAFRLETNDILGRHMVASRDIRKGELIFQESPLVLGPKSVTPPICLGCHKLCGDSGRECDGCGFPLCSVQCQVSDIHFDECQVMMKHKFRAKIEPGCLNLTHYNPIVPLRLLLMKEKQPEKYKKALSLESHLKERIGTPLYAVYKKNLVGFLRQRLGFETIVDDDTILTIAGILDTNAFEVRLRASASASGFGLRGLWPIAAMMAHDCKSNTRHTFHGPEYTMAVSATVDIPANALITGTYTQTFWGTLARRTHLLEAKFFACNCKRCSDPTELETFIGAFRCSKCATRENYFDGPKMLSTAPLDDNATWRCSNCDHQVPAKLVKAGNKNLKEEIERLDKSSPVALEAFLAKYGVEAVGILHPRNSFVIQVKHALIQMYGNRPGLLYSGKFFFFFFCELQPANGVDRISMGEGEGFSGIFCYRFFLLSIDGLVGTLYNYVQNCSASLSFHLVPHFIFSLLFPFPFYFIVGVGVEHPSPQIPP